MENSNLESVFILKINVEVISKNLAFPIKNWGLSETVYRCNEK